MKKNIYIVNQEERATLSYTNLCPNSTFGGRLPIESSLSTAVTIEKKTSN